MLPFFLVTVLTALSATNTSFALYIGQMTADYQYPLQRVVRMLALPLHQFIDFSDWNAWQCMVDNPLYVPGRMLSSNFKFPFKNKVMNKLYMLHINVILGLKCIFHCLKMVVVKVLSFVSQCGHF